MTDGQLITYDIGTYIRSAIDSFINWVSDNIRNFINWMWQSLTSAIVQPTVNAIQSWLTGFVWKIPRLIYVVTVVPVEIHLVKQMVRRPSLRTLGKIIATPFVGLIASRLTEIALNAYLGAPPATVAPIPSVPPTPPAVYGWLEKPIKIYDEPGVTDEVDVYTIAPGKVEVYENTRDKITDTVNVYTIAPPKISLIENTADKITDSANVYTVSVPTIALSEEIIYEETVEIT